MQTPEWLKPALIGAATGAVALTIVGFAWGGWVTRMKANTIAADKASAEVVIALLPFCMAQAEADPESAEIVERLNKASAYRRPDILIEAGWATPPGTTSSNRGLATACAAKLTDKS